MYDYPGYLKKYGKDILDGKATPFSEPQRYGEIFTSRGCPFNCSFCASQKIHGHKMRAHSIERVKREIDILVDEYNVRTINIGDDHFLYDVSRAIEVIDYIGSKNAKVIMPNGLAIMPITREFVDCLARNNVPEVRLALESGSRRVLNEIMHKPVDFDKVKDILEMFEGTNITVYLFLVVGFAEETVEDIKDGLNYLNSIRCDWSYCSALVPISGSAEFEKGFYKNIISNDGSYNFDISFRLCKELFKTRPDILEAFLDDPEYTINLDLNFVHNPQMRRGEYVKAAKRLSKLTEMFPDHAFAWYYLGLCNEKLGLSSNEQILRYKQIIKKSEFWRKYAEHFHLQM